MNACDVLKRSASNFPDKTTLIFGDQRIDYGNLNIRVNCLSNSLLNMGLKKGDRIAVLLHN
ncbi:MAG: AMP-binding protein [Desulfomonilaceae bacterium]